MVFSWVPGAQPASNPDRQLCLCTFNQAGEGAHPLCPAPVPPACMTNPSGTHTAAHSCHPAGEGSGSANKCQVVSVNEHFHVGGMPSRARGAIQDPPCSGTVTLQWFSPLSSKQVHLQSRSRDRPAGGGAGSHRHGCAGQAAVPTQGHGQTLQTTPQGRMLQQRLASLRRRILLKASPASGPAEPREGRWELLPQPPTPGDTWLPRQCPPAQHKPGTERGGGIWVSQRSSGMLTAPAGLFPRPGWWDMLRASKPSCPCPPWLRGAERGSALAPT